ncbi:hypothetical protein BSKO_09728 [Bryopsis sp. KO-2023]|nr:hypothetical protein BSKO_09728 [Bryopsis sp. KO-2023]
MASRVPRASTARLLSTANETPYDVCVVGRGMMGSAAIRHLAKKGVRVVGVGPDEKPRSDWGDVDVFGAHYDEGRVTRRTDPDPTWAALAARSIGRYAEIEEESGVKFYHEVGHLFVGVPGTASFDRRVRTACNAGTQTQRLNWEDLKMHFPYFDFPRSCEGLWEKTSAGWVSARGQVSAQTIAAERQGAVIVPEVVDRVEECEDGFLVHTETGKIFQSSKVLVAAGGFSNFRELIPRHYGRPSNTGVPEKALLDCTLKTAQVVRVALGGKDVERLSNMPSVICVYDSMGCYILPPIKHGDGKTYIKMGAEWKNFNSNDIECGKKELESYSELVDWYRNGGSSLLEGKLLNLLRDIVPALNAVDVISETCATTHTATGHAYCGMVSEKLGILVGGNGAAAKSADELGLMGAGCIFSESGWDHDFPQEDFLPRLKCETTGDRWVAQKRGIRSRVLARSWTEAAEGYAENFGFRFLPWLREAADRLAGSIHESCTGPILVPACGPGLELQILFDRFPGQQIVGMDISKGMVATVTDQFSGEEFGGRITALVGDASNVPELPGGEKYAMIYSTFGLQQFPDPVQAIQNWVSKVKCGGGVVVCFWPADCDQCGPWKAYFDIVQRSFPSKKTSDWEANLVDAVKNEGMVVVDDYYSSHEMTYENFDAFWKGTVEFGFMRASLLLKGERFMKEVEEELRQKFNSQKICHSPKARIMVLRKPLSSRL